MLTDNNKSSFQQQDVPQHGVAKGVQVRRGRPPPRPQQMQEGYMRPQAHAHLPGRRVVRKGV